MDYWQIFESYADEFHAGPKAQRDVAAILDHQGGRRFVVRRVPSSSRLAHLFGCLLWLIQLPWLRFTLPRRCVLLMQYPSSSWTRSPKFRLLTERVKKRHELKLVTVVHDLTSLRWGTSAFEDRRLSLVEQGIMRLFDRIIVHNESMKAALAKRGVPAEKMVCLKVFDYLTTVDPPKREFSKSVVIAGCLAPDKVGYLGGLARLSDIDWLLYGVKFDPARLCGSNIHYMGCFDPDLLPSKLEGAFGLIWDGPSIETCTGDLGNYLRINNPHKLSLYIASGLPIIIWRGAAEAGFVEKHRIGISVNSLDELPALLRSMRVADYRSMVQSVTRLAKSVRNGNFLAMAVRTCLEELK